MRRTNQLLQDADAERHFGLPLRKLQEAGTATDEALAQSLVDEYEVAYPEALDDTRQLLHQLEEMGVITIN